MSRRRKSGTKRITGVLPRSLDLRGNAHAVPLHEEKVNAEEAPS